MNLGTLAMWLLPRPASGRVLSPGESNTLAKLAEVALDGAPLSITPEQVSHEVDAFLAAGRSRHVWRCRLLLLVLEHAPLSLGATRFSRMTRRERAALVDGQLSRAAGLWWICAMSRNLVLLGAYSDPRRYIRGWDIPLEERVRFRRRGRGAS